MTHSAAMASEILPGKTILEALNTDLVCDAINTAMRELFLQIVYGRTQSAFSDDGLRIGAGLEDLGKGLRSMVGTMYGTKAKGARYLEMTEGYVLKMALDKDDQVMRLPVPLPGQDDGRHQEGHVPERSLREEHRHLRPLQGRGRRGEVDRPADRVNEGGVRNNGSF